MSTDPRLLEVIRLGHPKLRSVAEPVPEDWFASGRLADLGQDMVRTMIEEDGVGLAAPQVAEGIRLFTYWVPETDDEPELSPAVLVNPEIRPVGDDVEEGWEGCLSIPGLRGMVPRYRRLKVKARTVEGDPISLTADGFHARVLQHEYDHLDGIVFLDRMTSTQSLAFEPEWEKYTLSTEAEGD
ncbi:MAG: peptide deformylase [Acidobacteriota bacterium]|nr:peptide deformylase [Acidobacteriota bacterium]